MKRAHDFLETIAMLVGMVAAAGTCTACGGSKSGGPAGLGGAGQGTGGVPGSGGATQGTGGAAGNSGGGGAIGTGGSGSGGLATGGSGGSATGGGQGTGGRVGTGGNSSGTGGRSGAGGIGGSGGNTTVVSGAGGGGIDGGAAGNGTGGFGIGGAGGKATGGTAGMATGGAIGVDGGALDAPLAKCSDITTQSACDLRSDCHSVFEDPGTCGCATSGCCARFRSCADGDKADCIGPAACDMLTPHCESPYLVSYRDLCYEGCVKESDCGAPACPQAPPANGAACGPVSQTCYYEDCAGAGRTVATCAARVWKATTGACTALWCEPNPDSPYALTCSAGKICVITSSSGPALIVTPMCVDHNCGTGPIAPQCIPSLNGTCTATYSLAGVVVKCQTTSSCGDAACS